MGDQYPKNNLGLYLRHHDDAMGLLTSLFEAKDDGSFDFKDPEVDRQTAEAVVERMQAIPDERAAMDGNLETTFILGRGMRMGESYIRPKDGGERLIIGESEQIQRECAMRADFWKKGTDSVVDGVKAHLQAQPEPA